MARIQEVQLDFSNLSELDNGRVDRLLRFHLQRMSADLLSRPREKGKRKVTLEFSIVPVCNDEGECETAMVEIEAKGKVPLYRTKAYEMRVTNNGLLFNRDFPDAIEQPSLFPAAAQSTASPEEDDDDDEEDEDE